MSLNQYITFDSDQQKLITAIATSSGAADADKIPATGADGKLDASLLPSSGGGITKQKAIAYAVALGG